MGTQPLRERAAVAKNGPGTAVEQAGKAPTLRDLIDQMRPEIQRALPKHMDADRLARIALTLLKQTPALGQCTPESFLGALMTASQLGLEPGPLGEAYLVPYGKVCTFIPGYRGLIKLAWQSGQIESLRAETVCEADTFEVHYGSDPRIEHRRPKLGHPRGDAIGWYALAKFKAGGEAFVVMDREEVDAIRKRSKASGSGPWVTDFNAMAKKTCVRQLAKWLPLSPELAAALVQDGQVRTDVSREAIDVTGGEYIEGEVVDEDTGEITGEPGRPCGVCGATVEGGSGLCHHEDDQAAAGTAWPPVTPAGGAS